MTRLALVYILKAFLGAAFALGGLGPAAPLAVEGLFAAPDPAAVTAEEAGGDAVCPVALAAHPLQ
jgi:hypothetical protein